MGTDTIGCIEPLKIAQKVAGGRTKKRINSLGRREIKNGLMKRFRMLFYPQLPTPATPRLLRYVYIFSTPWIYGCLSLVNHPENGASAQSGYLRPCGQKYLSIFQKTLLCLNKAAGVTALRVRVAARHNNTTSGYPEHMLPFFGATKSKAVGWEKCWQQSPVPLHYEKLFK